MLRAKSKFRFIIAFYMILPVAIFIVFFKGTPTFQDPAFQAALSVCVAVITLITICNPVLLGLRWLFLNQLDQISDTCHEIKSGKYRYFSLPNQPSDDEDENELIFLMRNMNWMIHQIETRETELEARVAERTMDLEKTNAKLVTARDEANASAIAKSQFLATMSHEIRTPLNAVIGMSGLILKTALDERQKEYMEIINSSSKTLVKIINDILDFSKMDAGKLKIEKIPVNIRELLEEICDVFKHETADKSIELILDIDPKVPRVIQSDPTRLRQVLSNLISNAVKFTLKGEICLCVEQQNRPASNESILVFNVRDTGIGMDKKTLGTLFQAFTQADGSTSRKYGGTGLGLAICRKLVLLMGGDIDVKSQPEKGSSFSFTIKSSVIQQNTPVKRINLAGAKNKTVLLAIKNKSTNRIIHQFLADFGLSVCTVKSQDLFCEAPDKIKQTDKAALAVVDLDNPMIQAGNYKKRSKGNELPVIGIGAFNKDRRLYKPDWVSKFITKPVKQSLMFDAVVEMLNSCEKKPENNSCDAAAPKSQGQPGKKLNSFNNNLNSKKTLSDPDPDFLRQAVEKADILNDMLQKNSLKAKTYSKEFGIFLEATMYAQTAMKLESQIKRFDFEAARATFANLNRSLRTGFTDHCSN